MIEPLVLCYSCKLQDRNVEASHLLTGGPVCAHCRLELYRAELQSDVQYYQSIGQSGEPMLAVIEKVTAVLQALPPRVLIPLS